MRINGLWIALIIVVLGVGVSCAAEKGAKCTQACQAETDKCMKNNKGSSAGTRCNWDYQQCLMKCK